MLTVEERKFYAKINNRLDRIANSLETISKSLEILIVLIDEK